MSLIVGCIIIVNIDLSLCYISGNGNVYTWGRGTEGQLGHGEKIRFLTHTRRVPCKSLQCEVVHISCGELYSSAVTGRCEGGRREGGREGEAGRQAGREVRGRQGGRQAGREGGRLAGREGGRGR